jgi:hypothetical protein
LGHLLILHVTAANEQGRSQVGSLVKRVQEAVGDAVEVAFVGPGCSGQQAAQETAVHGLQLEFVKFPEAKRSFVLLPPRWGVEHLFARIAHFHLLTCYYERLPSILAGFHLLASAILKFKHFVALIPQST